ncbi:ATP synthase F1 subunit gamma [Deferribacter autotrophicus]|uniref:ATP synthase gamma chain n=1 Tax=Deferribacter autotrophicus TaxID=500465 RepID=A0A5A8F3Q3_9BACT|nr:ATP synthase F1 subunit gamma [Deferribacter autotrophicus]KAA0258498.1 ATP synthase F1 subunit gamma [Deferribacter autotrophicus]
MPGMRDIKRKIQSVKSTQKITKAMKMVSAAKLRKAQEAMEAARPYANKIYEVVSSIGKRVNPELHPFLQQKEEIKNICLVMFTSDRGLCGAFNANVIKAANRFVEENSDKNIKLICVGRRGYDFFRNRDVEIVEKYTNFSGKVTYDDAIDIGKVIVDKFLEGEFDEVYLLFNEFKSIVYHVPKVVKMLPLSFDKEEDEVLIDYLYEPKPDILLKNIMPKFINFTVYRALLESIAGEHGARMAAMDNATRNAGELIDKLVLSFNKARQAAITKEILDIVNGAEALK